MNLDLNLDRALMALFKRGGKLLLRRHPNGAYTIQVLWPGWPGWYL